MRSWLFTLVAVGVGAALFAVSRFIQNDYFFFAGYVVLQYIVLSSAWNILGGYCGYVNFGTAALFALGAYTSVALHKFLVTGRIYPDRKSTRLNSSHGSSSYAVFCLK